MNVPTAYCDLATFVNDHASLFLEKYGNLLTWRSTEKEVIADIGCANGSITTDVLLPFCGDNVDKIFGIDNSSDMIQLANERNRSSKVMFVEMDVAKENINLNMLEKFEHIFSFYCLHVIPDQRRVAENFFKMLKPGGEAFVTFLFKNSVMESHYVISQYEKWSPYIGNFPKVVAPYFRSAQPQEDFKTVFEDVGFTVESFKSDVLSTSFNREKFEKYAKGVNMLVSSIPEDLKEEFLKDTVELLTKMCKNGDSYVITMETIIAVARKPLN